jgi:hypothetical protein
MYQNVKITVFWVAADIWSNALHFLPERRKTSIELYGVASQKAITVLVTAVRTSNTTY